MVYQYKNNGYNMVLDVESGSVHVVDDLSYEVIGLYTSHSLEEIKKELSGYKDAEIEEVYEEIKGLESQGSQRMNTRIT